MVSQKTTWTCVVALVALVALATTLPASAATTCSSCVVAAYDQSVASWLTALYAKLTALTREQGKEVDEQPTDTAAQATPSTGGQEADAVEPVQTTDEAGPQHEPSGNT